MMNAATADKILAKVFRKLMKVKKMKSLLDEHLGQDSSIEIVDSMDEFIFYVEEHFKNVDDINLAEGFQANVEQRYQKVINMVMLLYSEVQKCSEVIRDDVN